MNKAQKKKLLVKSGSLVIGLLISIYACYAQHTPKKQEGTHDTKPYVLMLANIASPVAYSNDPDEKGDSLGLINGHIVYQRDTPYLVLYKKGFIEWADISLHNNDGYFLDQIFLSELAPNCTQIRVNLKGKNLEGNSYFLRVKLDSCTRFFSILTR